MKRFSIIIVFLLLALIMVNGEVFAQGCAMCTKTASQLDEGSAKGLNTGILYLAAIPLTILGTIGVSWWRKNRDSF